MTNLPERPGGVLFTKSQKTNPNQPDFDGKLTIDPAIMKTLIELWQNGHPVTLELAGWKKTSAKGANYLSLSSQLPRELRQAGGAQQKPTPRPQPQAGPYDDDVPF